MLKCITKSSMQLNYDIFFLQINFRSETNNTVSKGFTVLPAPAEKDMIFLPLVLGLAAGVVIVVRFCLSIIKKVNFLKIFSEAVV